MTDWDLKGESHWLTKIRILSDKVSLHYNNALLFPLSMYVRRLSTWCADGKHYWCGGLARRQAMTPKGRENA